MGKGIYVATSGSIAQLRHLELLSNNLANARTTGFKADRMTFEEVLAKNVQAPTVAERDKHFVQPRGAPADMAPGSLVQTDNPLDLALTGNGMLTIETPRGVRFIRAGQLVLGRDGVLMTHNGHPVLSHTGKRLVMPPDELPEIDPDGTIWTSGGEEVGKLGIATPDLTKGLSKEPDGTFMPAANTRPSPDLQVMQGHLEESNASPVRMMLELINVQRTFSALRQVISTSGEMDNLAARLPR